jgi:sulfonate transport system permease protein
MAVTDVAPAKAIDEARPDDAVARPAVPRALRWTVGLALPLALALGWEAAVRLGFAQGRLMPPPSRIADTLIALAKSGELATHALATLTRVALGFGFGALAGTILGAITGASEPLRRALDPTIQALRSIPSLAWVPLFILWLGIFETSKVTLIAVGVFFPVYLGVMGAIESIDRKLVEVGRVFRLSRPAMIRRVLLPAVLPHWVIALRSGLGLGFMFVVAAEIMGASEGLGYLLVDGQQLGKPDQILAAIIAFAILGKACDWLLVLATAPSLAWQDKARGRL